jgi:uncharacterized protein YjbI with pentapeptide repeats
MKDWIQLLKEDVNSFNVEIEKISIDERTMFKGLDLSNIDFFAANVKFCDFSESDLQFSQISGYLLSTCRLDKTNLNNTLLDTIFWKEKIKTLKLIWGSSEQWNRVKLSNNPIIISEGNFLNGNFGDMDFRDVSFTSCIFNSSSFNASQMESVRFKNIKSYNVSFQRAILDKSSWEDIVLEDSKLNESQLKKTVFKNVIFKNILFNKANCQEAYFEKCKFVDCHFFGTDLTKTTFSNCDFKNSRIEEGIMIGVTVI